MPTEVTVEQLQTLSPSEFESICRHAFEILGYKVEQTPLSGDEGVDLVLTKQGEQTSTIAQCKRYAGQVGPAVVREFYGAMRHEGATRGYIVTTGTFSVGSMSWAQGKGITLVDGPELSVLLSSPGADLRPWQLDKPEEEGDRFWTEIELIPEDRPMKVLIEGPPPGQRSSYRPLLETVAAKLGGVMMDSPDAAKAQNVKWQQDACEHSGPPGSSCPVCGAHLHSWRDECGHSDILWDGSPAPGAYRCAACGGELRVMEKGLFADWHEVKTGMECQAVRSSAHRAMDKRHRMDLESLEDRIKVNPRRDWGPARKHLEDNRATLDSWLSGGGGDVEITANGSTIRAELKDEYEGTCAICHITRDAAGSSAQRFAPLVVFIDEMDALPRREQDELVDELDAAKWKGAVIATTWERPLREKLRRRFDLVFGSSDVSWSPN